MIGCHDNEYPIYTDEPFFPGTKEVVNTTVVGQVIDENEVAIKDALVTLLSGNTRLEVRTDESGQFIFEGIENEGPSAYVSVRSAGMFEAYRRLPVFADRYNYTEIKMATRSKIGEVNSAEGGRITTDYGASIQLPAEGIVDQTGKYYEGNVNVAMRWIDPAAEDLSENMIGDLSGLDENGELRSLATYGMLQVDLLDDNGNALDLSGINDATLEFPVPASMRDNAPSTIPLWSYDEEIGIWVKEGVAIFDISVYRGKVSHFSSWNVDAEFGSIDLKGQVVLSTDKNKVDASYLSIFVEGENIGKIGGWLCDDGSFLYYNFPENEVFDLVIIDDCDNVLYKETLGPYQTDEDLGTIEISLQDNSSIVKVQGTALNCKNEPISNGAVAVSFANRDFYFDIEDDGSYNFSIDMCDGGEAKVSLIELDSLKTTDVIVNDTKLTWDLGEQSICDELENYVSVNNILQDTIYVITENLVAVAFYYEDDEEAEWAIAHIDRNSPECDNEEAWENVELDRFLVAWYSRDLSSTEVIEIDDAEIDGLFDENVDLDDYIGELNDIDIDLKIDDITWYTEILGRIEGSFRIIGHYESGEVKDIMTAEFSIGTCRFIDE